MPRELKNIRVRLISLVKEGANQKTLIYKDAELTEIARVKLTKNDPELGVAYGIVYAPDETDTQGDKASAEEIREAAYEFVRCGGGQNVDINHDMRPRDDAYICESWIIKSGDPLFTETGAWAVGVKLESEELRNAVKSGDLAALSIYGEASVSKAGGEKGGEADKTGLTNAIISAFERLFKEADLNNRKETRVNEEQVTALIKGAFDGFEAKLTEALTSQTERFGALETKTSQIEAELSKSKQDDGVKKTDAKPIYEGVL